MSYAEEERERAMSKSLVLAEFKGVRNNVPRERLGEGEFESVKNIDVDDSLGARRRRGKTRVGTGAFHSLKELPLYTCVVKDGELGILNADHSHAALGVTVGSDRVCYTAIGDTTYFSSDSASGKIMPDRSVAPWGSSDESNTWLSPVVNPTDTLNPIAGKLLGKPPYATALTELNGRIYMAQGQTLWATELYMYDYVDKTRTFIQFEHEITALGRVTNGLYVGTTHGAFYLSGPFGQMQRFPVATSGVLPGSLVEVEAGLVRPERNMSRMALMFTTDEGIHVGLDEGVCYNVTDDKVLLPEGTSAAAMFRQQDGISQYVTAIESGGTPTSSARVGDYADAEIVRFGG